MKLLFSIRPCARPSVLSFPRHAPDFFPTLFTCCDFFKLTFFLLPTYLIGFCAALNS